MTRKNWLDLGPSLLLAAGILAATWVAVLTSASRVWVLAGPLLLALSVVGAGVWAARQRGESSGPSWAALLLGGSFVLASAIVALKDPHLVSMLLPILGPLGWAALQSPVRRCA